ncbi:MAG: NAD(P)-dependent dehydrogenase (short-subunit alcohol dehydrogenase family) [Halieaceae bacterium]|jgi:NAD(P)-dependent dehydrogenase (short-subunit alcohol dehydrogenase family)
MSVKTAVVTGSSHGLGKAIAQALIDRGINVVVSGPSLADCRHAVHDLTIQKGGARAIAVSCDIRSRRALIRLRRITHSEFGSIDIWVNNAGIALTGTDLAQLPEDEWRLMVDVNLTGTLLACQVAIGALRESGGAIYNILGAGADGAPVPRMGGYATTKAALTFLTKSLAQELGDSPIIVGGLSPGLIITRGFLREHAKIPAEMRTEREKVVNLIADHPETVSRWAAKIIDTNRANSRTFNWLTPAKIQRRQMLKHSRDVLSRYRS